MSTAAANAAVTIDERGTTNQCPSQGGGPCELRYLGNEILTLRARPPAGWRFDRWSGCEVARNAAIVIVMPQRDLDCQAHFFAFDDGFDVALLPQRVTAAPGTLATSQLTIERGARFGSGPIQIGLAEAPPFISLAAPTAAVTGNIVALALNVSASAVPGHHLVSIRAEAPNAPAGAVVRTVTMAVDVSDAGDFYLSLQTPTLSISPGTSCTLDVDALRHANFLDDITFDTSTLPAGVSAAFDPNPLVGNTTQWVLTADAQAAFGEQEVTVSGRAGLRGRSAALRLAVTAARDSCARSSFATTPTVQDFTLALSATSLTQPQGEIGAVDITIDRSGGYQGEVFFSTSGAPPGTLLKFEFGASTFGNSKRLILLTSPTAPLGSHDIDIVAAGGGLLKTARLQLQITAGAQFCPLAAMADTFAGAFWSSAPPSSILEVSSRTLGSAAKTYLAFDMSQVAPPFDKVELVLSLFSNDWAADDPDGSRTVVVHGITDNADWSPAMLPEPALSWDNAPKNDRNSAYAFVGAGSTPAAPVRSLGGFAVMPNHARGHVYRVDVTDYARWGLGLNSAYSDQAARDGDGILTFALGNNKPYDVGSSDFTLFNPRESPTECWRPHLEVY